MITDGPVRIAVSGSSGLVGSALRRLLEGQGRQVLPIVRGKPADPSQIAWDTTSNTFDAEGLSRCDAVVHLAGESVMGRWSQEKKRRIFDSRVDSTRALARCLAEIENGPRTLILASAIGYYGDTGQDEPRTEDDPSGDPATDFLAEVCVAWEQAADAARQAGIRVVHVRIGIVLSPNGGALKEMLLPFKLGLGGPIGRGDQWMSWIALHDMVRVLAYCLDTTSIVGAVNATAPGPVTNKQFGIALGKALGRPAVLPTPPLAIKLIYGKECAEATALRSMRVQPKRLMDAGFTFDYDNVASALRYELEAK